MTHAPARAIGLDFGTTNSAIALATPAGAVLATFQDGNRQTTTFRSVLYFDPDELTSTRKPVLRRVQRRSRAMYRPGREAVSSNR